AVAPFLALALVFSLLPKSDEEKNLDGFSVGLLTLEGYFVITQVFLPLGYALVKHTIPATSLTVSFYGLFLLLAWGLIRWRNPVTYALLVTLSLGEMGAALIGVIGQLRSGGSTFWDLSMFCFLLSSLFLFVQLG